MGQTYSTDLLPNTTGLALGAPNQLWEIYADVISANVINGNVLGGGGASTTLVTVPFSATPTFTPASPICTFSLTLTGNVTASSFVTGGLTGGALITFILRQSAGGGWLFTWPTNVLGGMSIDPGANENSVQTFIFDGLNLYAIAPGTVYP